MSDCPGEETLRLLGTNTFGEATYAAIEQHVESCPACKTVLERLACRHPDSTAIMPDSVRWPNIPGFDIQAELDRGGMGVVYLAIETGLDRLVALKILPGALGPDSAAGPRRRWLREARAISSVRHPNVVPLYDYGEANEWFFMVLEYIPGGTLKQRLTEPLPSRTAAELIETIARAVAFVHGCGLLHLDLKPSNILLDGDKLGPWGQATPRISDFGLALSSDGPRPSETSLAGVRGTPTYMAPEQAAGASAAVGAAADIHALGAILYELLTGRPPFRGASTLETLDQVRNQSPVPPRRLNPKIPRDLETIALKCLEKKPSTRYASADSLASDLRRWLDGRPIQARPVSSVEHATRWYRRQPLSAALALAFSLTLIGGFLGLWALLLRSEALRLRSEADYQVASHSLDNLTDMFSDDAEANGRNFQYFRDNQRWKTIERARTQQIELSKRAEHDIRNLRRLAIIDTCLTTFRMANGKLDEARSLMEEGIRSWEACLALAPDDSDIRARLLVEIDRILLPLTEGANDHLYERWNAKAIATLKGLEAPHQADRGGAVELSRLHRVHADTLMANGESDRARSELQADLELIRSLSVANSRCLAFALSEALTLAALGKWQVEFTAARSPRRHPSHGENHLLEMSVAEFTARRIGWLPAVVRSTGLPMGDLPTEVWVNRVIDAIQSDAAQFGLDRTHIPVTVHTPRTFCTVNS